MSSSSDDDPVRGNPVSRDGFFYDGHKFYVKIDDKHEHTRCPASDLHALLAHYPPAGSEILPKTQAPKPRKDEPAHFYTAQMVHYGVPKPMKTRDPAKRKLSAAYALNSGASIAVPENILKLESELIQEYRAGGNGAAGLASVEDETSTACRTSAHTVGDDYLWGPDLRCCLERYSQKDLVDLLMRVADDDSDSATLINKKLWKLRNHDPDNSRSAAEPSKPRSKQTARRTGGLPFGTRADKREVSKVRFEETKESAAGSVQPLEQAVAPVKRPRTKQTARRGGPPPRPQRLHVPSNAPFQSMGAYLITADGFADLCNYGEEEDMQLEVRTSSTGAHLWGKFNFGSLEGVLRSTGKTPTVAGKQIPLTWRGENTGDERQMWIGERQIGWIKFLSGGKVKGHLDGFMAEGDFTGHLFESDVRVKEVAAWKNEWRGLNQAAYNAASVSRWGKWVETPRADGPSASDTSAAGDSGEDDESDNEEMYEDDSE